MSEPNFIAMGASICHQSSMKTDSKSITFIVCTVGQKKKKTIYFNTNYRIEMKLVSVIMDYWLLQLDALKFFLGIRLHGGLYLNLIFSM